jgi:hypothetical protein
VKLQRLACPVKGQAHSLYVVVLKNRNFDACRDCHDGPPNRSKRITESSPLPEATLWQRPSRTKGSVFHRRPPALFALTHACAGAPRKPRSSHPWRIKSQARSPPAEEFNSRERKRIDNGFQEDGRLHSGEGEHKMVSSMKLLGAFLMAIGLAAMLWGIAVHAKCRSDATACCVSLPVIGLLCA